jgi:hypothetical protein
MVNYKFYAAALSLITAGSMAWVSFISVPTLLHFSNSSDTKTLVSLFSVWWPLGKRYMGPLIGLSTAAQAWAWYDHRKPLYIASGLSLVSIGVFTGIFMKEDINGIRNGSGDNVVAFTKDFCFKHHVRLGLATFAGVCSLWSY